jgi:hypothetical protein
MWKLSDETLTRGTSNAGKGSEKDFDKAFGCRTKSEKTKTDGTDG